MTNDEHEALIKKAAQAIRLAYAKEMYTGMGFESAAEAAFAVFEEAHTPTDDEREALARLFDGHWMTLHGKCACGWVHPQYGSRSLDPIYVRQHLADAVLDAGFRRPVQAEPTEAQLIDLYWKTSGDDWAIPEWLMVAFGRAAAAQVHEGIKQQLRHGGKITDDVIQWDIRDRDAAMRLFAAEVQSTDTIRCDYCGDALPSVESRADAPTTPDLQQLGFAADKIVCPECVTRARSTDTTTHERDHMGICRHCGQGITAKELLDGEERCTTNENGSER